MPVLPYVVPARPETSYPDTRVAALSVQQARTGGPVTIGYQIDRYRLAGGVPDDAPPEARVTGTVTLGMAAILADPTLAQAFGVINEYVLRAAVSAGLLTEAP